MFSVFIILQNKRGHGSVRLLLSYERTWKATLLSTQKASQQHFLAGLQEVFRDPGYGILKQNGGEIWDCKFARKVGC